MPGQIDLVFASPLGRSVLARHHPAGSGLRPTRSSRSPATSPLGQVFASVSSDSSTLPGTLGTLDLTSGTVAPFSSAFGNPRACCSSPPIGTDTPLGAPHDPTPCGSWGARLHGAAQDLRGTHWLGLGSLSTAVWPRICLPSISVGHADTSSTVRAGS